MVKVDVELSDAESASEIEEEPTITHSDALKPFETGLKYVEQQENANPSDILLMRRWIRIAAQNRITKSRQLSITSFFNL